MLLIEAILSGIWATVFMDILARILAKRKIIYPFMSQAELGRWFLYLFRGKLVHQDIRQTSPLKNEMSGYYLSHYLIGIFLAGFYLLLADNIKIIGDNDWLSLVFGIMTVMLPWFWLLPATGFGFMAGKSSKRKLILKTNLINHTNFGIGIYLWFILFHNCFMSFINPI